MTNSTVTYRLLSPLHHGAFSTDTGNVGLVRRESVRLSTGEVVAVPCVSGGAIRGILRRLIMRELLDRLGLGFDS